MPPPPRSARVTSVLMPGPPPQPRAQGSAASALGFCTARGPQPPNPLPPASQGRHCLPPPISAYTPPSPPVRLPPTQPWGWRSRSQARPHCGSPGRVASPSGKWGCPGPAEGPRWELVNYQTRVFRRAVGLSRHTRGVPLLKRQSDVRTRGRAGLALGGHIGARPKHLPEDSGDKREPREQVAKVEDQPVSLEFKECPGQADPRGQEGDSVRDHAGDGWR